jgi:hypothetical protein
MKVFVLSRSGKPLMPTTPRRARIFLKTRRARVVSHEPFTIQLRFETTTHTQPVTVGVDTGAAGSLRTRMDNHSFTFPSHDWKGGRRFLPQLKHGVPAPLESWK